MVYYTHYSNMDALLMANHNAGSFISLLIAELKKDLKNNY